MSSDTQHYPGSASKYQPSDGALIGEVSEEGPAARAGLMPGMRIDLADGQQLSDAIDWLWIADGSRVELEVTDSLDESQRVVALERTYGEDWGFSFERAIFDDIRTCINTCTFCFMKMLPAGMRKSLYIKDDDYRLSFLQGNFVTLTNVSDKDVARIISMALSPINVSLHAVSSDIRRMLIGKHHQRGLDVLDELLNAGIEIHAQIVLIPGVNDGEELEKSLAFVEERPGITSLGIVPLGFTRHQSGFAQSFTQSQALHVVNQISSAQERSRCRTGRTRFQLSDEFYLLAQVDIPVADYYDGYPQYGDGIGMIRSFLDEVDCFKQTTTCDAMRELNDVLFVTGVAFEPYLHRALHDLGDHKLSSRTMAIANNFFGGNVDVAGLLTGQDILEQMPSDIEGCTIVLPSVIFNESLVTLDDVSFEELKQSLLAQGAHAVVQSDVLTFLEACNGIGERNE